MLVYTLCVCWSTPCVYMLVYTLCVLVFTLCVHVGLHHVFVLVYTLCLRWSTPCVCVGLHPVCTCCSTPRVYMLVYTLCVCWSAPCVCLCVCRQQQPIALQSGVQQLQRQGSAVWAWHSRIHPRPPHCRPHPVPEQVSGDGVHPLTPYRNR